MSHFSFGSLRFRALLLVLLALLPVFGLTLYSYLDQRRRAIREVQKGALSMARSAAQTQETIISSGYQLLVTLGQAPQVRRRDAPGCAALFAALAKERMLYQPSGR